VTFPLFQPLALDAVRFWKVIEGEVTSRLIVTELLDVPPELVAVHVTVVLPSALTVVVVVSVAQEADREVTADSGSLTAKLTRDIAGPVPAVRSIRLAGVTTGVITGGVLSVTAV
jgi:hypothetical protein